MYFCPSCKSIMIPKIVDDKRVLVCRSCGHKVRKFRVGEYKLTEVNKHTGRDIIIVEEEIKRTPEEDRKYQDDLYGTEIDLAED